MDFQRDIVIRNLATICVLGYLIYWIFPFPPIFWRIGIIVLTFYTFSLRDYNLTAAEKIILVFSGLWFFYYILSFIYTVPETYNLGNMLCNSATFCIFIYLGSRGVLTERYFNIVALLLIVCGYFFYVHFQQQILAKLGNGEDVDITNNGSVFFVMLLPILFFLKNKVQSWITLVVCLFFIILSAKRGNILACIIPIILFVIMQLKESKKMFSQTALVIVLLAIVSYLSYSWFTGNAYLMHRLDMTLEGDSSKRDIIYSALFNGFLDSDSYLYLLFGHGYDGTMYYINRMAHNDWLQCAFDYGLVGIGIYVMFLFQIILVYRRTVNPNLKFVYLAVLAIWLVKSLVSMALLGSITFILMIFLGAATGMSLTEQEEQNDLDEDWLTARM